MIVEITHCSKIAGSLGFDYQTRVSRRALQGLPPNAARDYPATVKEAARVALYSKQQGHEAQAYEDVQVHNVKIVEV